MQGNAAPADGHGRAEPEFGCDLARHMSTSEATLGGRYGVCDGRAVTYISLSVSDKVAVA